NQDILKLQAKIDEHPNANSTTLAEFESEIQNLKNQLKTALGNTSTPNQIEILFQCEQLIRMGQDSIDSLKAKNRDTSRLEKLVGEVVAIQKSVKELDDSMKPVLDIYQTALNDLQSRLKSEIDVTLLYEQKLKLH